MGPPRKIKGMVNQLVNSALLAFFRPVPRGNVGDFMGHYTGQLGLGFRGQDQP